ncbi:MAG: tRNA glutamyl-Q(34) synthetase GluQRS [Gammaproteobacteria bacterium]|nr:tRNA glutamyl-Q(34) synthetase GluQRS [Gammaproteobacteria bacterium]
MDSPLYNSQYRGRFAPSPTGSLHMGSLFTALGSYLQAKKHGGKWLVRIEDLDPPREIKGAADSILRTLESYGLYWDEDVVYQSQRHGLYEQVLSQLDEKELLFKCTCSRKSIKEIAASGPIGFIYPGNCRDKKIISSSHAVRLKTSDTVITINDLLQGTISQSIAKQIGDIKLKRADGLYSYQLAVIIDDCLQNITEVVRGFDLFECTPIQIFLQQLLNYPTPRYLHLPILVNEKNEKLSKQTKAQAVSISRVEKTLFTLLTQMNQNPPLELKNENKQTILTWAINHWDHQKVTGKTIMTVEPPKN